MDDWDVYGQVAKDFTVLLVGALAGLAIVSIAFLLLGLAAGVVR